jgi:hypothetical protein
MASSSFNATLEAKVVVQPSATGGLNITRDLVYGGGSNDSSATIAELRNFFFNIYSFRMGKHLAVLGVARQVLRLVAAAVDYLLFLSQSGDVRILAGSLSTVSRTVHLHRPKLHRHRRDDAEHGCVYDVEREWRNHKHSSIYRIH